MVKKKHRLSIDLTPEQYSHLKKIAAERGISMTKLVSEALELHDVYLKYQNTVNPSKKEEYVDLDDETFKTTIMDFLTEWHDFAAKLSKL